MKALLATVTMQFFATQKYVPESRKTSNFLHIMSLTGTLHVQGDRNSTNGLGRSLQSAQEQGQQKLWRFQPKQQKCIYHQNPEKGEKQ